MLTTMPKSTSVPNHMSTLEAPWHSRSVSAFIRKSTPASRLFSKTMKGSVATPILVSSIDPMPPTESMPSDEKVTLSTSPPLASHVFNDIEPLVTIDVFPPTSFVSLSSASTATKTDSNRARKRKHLNDFLSESDRLRVETCIKVHSARIHARPSRSKPKRRAVSLPVRSDITLLASMKAFISRFGMDSSDNGDLDDDDTEEEESIMQGVPLLRSDSLLPPKHGLRLQSIKLSRRKKTRQQPEIEKGYHADFVPALSPTCTQVHPLLRPTIEEELAILDDPRYCVSHLSAIALLEARSRSRSVACAANILAEERQRKGLYQPSAEVLASSHQSHMRKKQPSRWALENGERGPSPLGLDSWDWKEFVQWVWAEWGLEQEREQMEMAEKEKEKRRERATKSAFV